MGHKQDRARAKAGLVFRDGKLVQKQPPKLAKDDLWNQRQKVVQNEG